MWRFMLTMWSRFDGLVADAGFLREFYGFLLFDPGYLYSARIMAKSNFTIALGECMLSWIGFLTGWHELWTTALPGSRSSWNLRPLVLGFRDGCVSVETPASCQSNNRSWTFMNYTLPETNIALKIGHPKRKLVFQPSIFRCELLVSGRVTQNLMLAVATCRAKAGMWTSPSIRSGTILIPGAKNIKARM